MLLSTVRCALTPEGVARWTAGAIEPLSPLSDGRSLLMGTSFGTTFPLKTLTGVFDISLVSGDTSHNILQLDALTGFGPGPRVTHGFISVRAADV
jgi:hypothetical protein